MEWPIRKSGAVLGSELRKEVMSARTRDVGPVRPRSDLEWTERPQPLGWGVRYGRMGGRKGYGRVPLIEAVDFDTSGCEGGEESVVGIACCRISSVRRLLKGGES